MRGGERQAWSPRSAESNKNGEGWGENCREYVDRAFWISQKGAIERERSPQPPEQRMMSSAVRGAAGVDMNLATAARQAGVPAECPYLREKGCMAGRGGG